jgi:hypothetical protein
LVWRFRTLSGVVALVKSVVYFSLRSRVG